MSYLLDKIHSATIYKRPKEGSLEVVDIVGHWGIVVVNDSGSYLVHNMPDTGTTATSISNLSNNWTPVAQLQVGPNKTIQGMFNSTGLVAYLPEGFVKYVSQGFCTGATGSMATYLSQ
ncbi:unnamed protein product (macronuclear) [Paramecium tetraurelia]|uniref:Uncharacterized protein n=1 Tax=Paramecium tetraurelia TaxID=5888 RepID=A0C2Y9_PARTE|nr:uncharacterized protein GSPATT00034634001 [Paramecium tetraurelia]CAK65156.1 unnamed protein product [Paramecium tetraurelia]|eukprot:XP_001432553.1 hypothetical protein (macronuclear) [Paramecium tetraurelia strain d4-2]